jgi:hypothetical protein
MSSNFSALIVSWRTPNIIIKRHQLSKSFRQECSNGKDLLRMLSHSNKLLMETILNIKLSSST